MNAGRSRGRIAIRPYQFTVFHACPPEKYAFKSSIPVGGMAIHPRIDGRRIEPDESGLARVNLPLLVTLTTLDDSEVYGTL
jgi:hypothetical protein